jgi:hypothetical protein
MSRVQAGQVVVWGCAVMAGLIVLVIGVLHDQEAFGAKVIHATESRASRYADVVSIQNISKEVDAVRPR